MDSDAAKGPAPADDANRSEQIQRQAIRAHARRWQERPDLAQIGFLAVILAYGLLLLNSMGDLSSNARLFPFLVLSGVAVLWGIKLLAALAPKSFRRMREPDPQADRRPVSTRTGMKDASAASQPPPAWMVWLWVATSLVLMLMCGFLVGTGLAVLLYLRLVARERWAHAIAASAITSLVVYVVFGRALRVDLGVGLVPGLF